MSKYYKSNRRRSSFIPNFFTGAILIIGIIIILKSALKKDDTHSSNKYDLQQMLHAAQPKIILLISIIVFFYIMYFVIKYIRKASKRRKLRMSGIFRIDKMTGEQFEDYLSVYFKDLGYQIEKHQGGKGDRGADKLIFDPKLKKRIVVQAKLWSSNITYKALQEVHLARELYNCDEAWIITNRGFTKQLIEDAGKINVQLWDRDRLIENMVAYNKKKHKLKKTMS